MGKSRDVVVRMAHSGKGSCNEMPVDYCRDFPPLLFHFQNDNIISQINTLLTACGLQDNRRLVNAAHPVAEVLPREGRHAWALAPRRTHVANPGQYELGRLGE